MERRHRKRERGEEADEPLMGDVYGGKRRRACDVRASSQVSLRPALTRYEAAVRLQRWSRRTLQVRTWSASHSDGGRRSRTTRLVEPCGVAYDICASSLALAYVATGSLAHPITRRPLLGTEWGRVLRNAEPRLQLLARWTMRHQEVALRACQERDSLLVWSQGEAGDLLDQALLAAETAEEFEQVHDALADYRRAMRTLRRRCQYVWGETLELHRTQTLHRAEHCDSLAWRDVMRSLEVVGREGEGMELDALQRFTTPLATWLLSET